MEILLEQSKINISTLNRLMLKFASYDVSNLSQPCFKPKLKVTYHELLNATKLKDKDIKEFIKRTYKGTPVEKSQISNEPATNLLLFIMWYAIKKRNTNLYKTTVLYHMIRQYSHLLSKHFKQFCNEEVFAYSLETLTKTHLFSREKTIANSLMYLSKELIKKYTNDIRTFNINEVIQFIYVSRHRISQSVKSFAEQYYRSWNSGAALKTYQDSSDEEQNKYQTQTLERGKRVIDVAVKQLTIYKTIDKNAMKEALRITKIKITIADILTKQLNNMKYSDEIRLILQLFIKDINNTSMLCGKNYELHVKKLMAIKRTRARIYFKQQISILTTKMLKETNLLKTFLSYTTQTQFIIYLYLAYYLTMVLKNTVC